MSTFRNCSACVCISSHWTRVAESSWDVDRAVRACIETTRSIALVGNSSVACREAAHQLKFGQYLVTTIVQLAYHEVAGTLNKHNVQTWSNLPVAPSLAFTDCTPTEGLTLACPINDVQIPIAYSRPLCSAYNKAIVDIFDSTTWGQARTHLQPDFLQKSHVLRVALKSDINKRIAKETQWLNIIGYDSKYIKIPEDCTALEATVVALVALLTLLDLLMLLTLPPLSNQILQQHANARKYHVKTNTSINLHIINSPTVHLIPLFLSLLISFNLFLSLSISSYRFLSLAFLLWLVTLKGFEHVPPLPMALLLLRAGKSPSSFGRTPWETSLHEFECLHDTAVVLGTWTNSSLHHASQLDIVLCADYLAAISGVDEALTRASDFIDLRLKLGSCQRSEIVQHVYCISSHWTRVAESSWDVDRAVRACIETTRSIALVGNSSVACREAAHQLKFGQYLVTTIVQLAYHDIPWSCWNPQQTQRTSLIKLAGGTITSFHWLHAYWRPHTGMSHQRCANPYSL